MLSILSVIRMCKFCERLGSLKQVYQFLNKHDKKQGEEKIKHEYTVALVTHSWLPSKGKKRASRSTDYRNQGLGYKLNFCPECGRNLRK